MLIIGEGAAMMVMMMRMTVLSKRRNKKLGKVHKMLFNGEGATMMAMMMIPKIFKQARKSSEDTHFTGYARFEKVWAR